MFTRTIALILFAFLLTPFSSARAALTHTVMGTFGVTATFVSGLPAANAPKSKVNLFFGGYYELVFAETYGVELGVIYMKRHMRTAIGPNDDRNFNIKSFYFPLLFRYHFIPWLSAGVGPAFTVISTSADIWLNDSDQVTSSVIVVESSEISVTYSVRGQYDTNSFPTGWAFWMSATTWL